MLSRWLDVQSLFAGGRSGIGAGHQSQHGIQRQNGGAAVAHEGHGLAGHRHDAEHTAYVDEELDDQQRRRARRDQAAGEVWGVAGDLDGGPEE